MGFMDKFKQAGEAAAAGMDPRNIGVAAAVNRIGHAGVETKAILKSLDALGGAKLGGGTEYALEIEVQPADGPAYPATIRQQLIPQTVAHYEQNIGGEIVVKIDPADPSKMVLWG